jgi:hypothetical protein
VFVAMKILLRNNKFATYLVTTKITNYFNRSRNQLQQKKLYLQTTQSGQATINFLWI